MRSLVAKHTGWIVGSILTVIALMLNALPARAACPSEAPAPAQETPLDPVARYGTDRLLFDVERKGKIIGTHETSFAGNGAKLVVENTMKLNVGFLFIDFFEFDYNATEIWCNGRFTRLQSTANRNGKIIETTAIRKNGAIDVESPKGDLTLDPDIIPSNHWNVEVLNSQAVLNTLTGGPDRVEILKQGTEEIIAEGQIHTATHYRYTGDLNVDVWYDDQGRWVKLRFPAEDGSTIEYVCRQCGLAATPVHSGG